MKIVKAIQAIQIETTGDVTVSVKFGDDFVEATITDEMGRMIANYDHYHREGGGCSMENALINMASQLERRPLIEIIE